MINYIKGKILNRGEEYIIVENGGLGYKIFVPEKRVDAYKNGEIIELYNHEHIREDARDLYGLTNMEELNFFTKLISISGVGPKLALKIFSLGTLSKITKAIDEENAAVLSAVPGVGKKTAQKIILELRGKLTTNFGLDIEDQDALEALANLGYQPARVREMLKDLPETAKTSEEKIRAALKLLGRQKTSYKS